MNRAGIAATALVVLAAAGSAGAWFTGTRMETVIQDNIVRANQQLKDQLPDTDLALSWSASSGGYSAVMPVTAWCWWQMMLMSRRWSCSSAIISSTDPGR